MIKQFRKKPVVIDAIQWDGTLSHARKIEKAFKDLETRSMTYHEQEDTCDYWRIGTLEGSHIVSKGDFVIKGVHGEFYPCKPDIFAKTYDTVENDTKS